MIAAAFSSATAARASAADARSLAKSAPVAWSTAADGFRADGFVETNLDEPRGEPIMEEELRRRTFSECGDCCACGEKSELHRRNAGRDRAVLLAGLNSCLGENGACCCTGCISPATVGVGALVQDTRCAHRPAG